LSAGGSYFPFFKYYFMKADSLNKQHPCFTGKLFRVAGQHYFFNTLAGSIDTVCESTASVLSDCSNSHGGCDVQRANPVQDDLRPFIKNPHSRDEIEATLNSKLRLLILELTRSCNMACTYCIDGKAYNLKDSLDFKSMREDVALRGVDYFLEHSSDQINPLAISFYGGEPLLRFPLLKKVVKYAKTRADEKNKNIGFSVTTNGTLLTKNIAKFLIDNSILLVISLDGPKEINDHYRSFKKGGGTFEVVTTTLEMVRNLDPDYFDKFVSCSVVVTPGSDSEKLQSYFNNLRVNIIANFVDTYGLNEPGIDRIRAVDGLQTLKAGLVARLVKDGPKYFDQWDMSKDFGAVLLSPMIKKFLKIENASQEMGLGQCVLGASRLYLSADNFYYPCEKIAGHSFARIGTIETGIDIDRVTDIIGQFYKMAEERCSGCWISSRCSMCLTLACSGDHLDKNKFEHYCRGTKAWGEFALEMLILARLNMPNEALQPTSI
jgi:uncharacterized protein